MDKKSKILIADSQFLIVESLKILIETEGYLFCGCTDNKQELVKLLKSSPADLLITDYNHIDFEGPDDLRSIIDKSANLPVLILVNDLSSEDLDKFMKAGFKNFALKTDAKEDLSTSIEMALRRKKYLSGHILDKLIESGENKGETKRAEENSSNLTRSEKEIIKLIADGHTTKEIAVKKNISFHTVMSHRKNIFRKLEINNVSELIKIAIRKGLIDYIEYNI